MHQNQANVEELSAAQKLSIPQQLTRRQVAGSELRVQGFNE
jgi:hypothetical protein